MFILSKKLWDKNITITIRVRKYENECLKTSEGSFFDKKNSLSHYLTPAPLIKYMFNFPTLISFILKVTYFFK